MCHLQQILHHLSALLSLMPVAPRVATCCCPSKSTHRSDDSNVQNGPTSSPPHNLSSLYEMDTLNNKRTLVNSEVFSRFGWLLFSPFIFLFASISAYMTIQEVILTPWTGKSPSLKKIKILSYLPSYYQFKSHLYTLVMSSALSQVIIHRC